MGVCSHVFCLLQKDILRCQKHEKISKRANFEVTGKKRLRIMRRLQNCKGPYMVCIARPQGAQSSDFFNYYLNYFRRYSPLFLLVGV